MTEDETWAELERRQQAAQAHTLEAEAVQRAAYLIMTLRKAFEIGYRAGAHARQRKHGED